MATFRCRSLKPKVSEWREIEAETPELAANEYHSFWSETDVRVTDDRVENRRYKIGFMRVEVEGYDAWVSRMFYYGIWRKGGVKPWGLKSFAARLKEAAEIVGWEHDPMELIEDGWEGEEPAPC